MNKNNILALANHMDSLPPERYDQTRAIHGGGGPSCLLAYMLAFFGDPANPDNPRDAREAAERILGIEYGQAASLYHGNPFGRDAERPTTKDAVAVLRRLAAEEYVRWVRIQALP